MSVKKADRVLCFLFLGSCFRNLLVARPTRASEGGAVVFLLMRRKKLSLMCRPRARLREADLMLRKNIVILLHHVHNQRYRHRQFDVCYVL